VRICRITAFYRKSIQDAINLVDYFHSKNIQNIRLYIIGVVQDTSTFNDFKENHLVKSGHVKFFTDPAYTDEASKMLYLADAIIGTGRGLMEAASLSKPLLVINRNGEIPVLLNELNFDDAFKTNFSERNVFPKLNDNDNKESITRIISDKENYNANGSFVRQSFEKYFSLEKTKEAYQTAYNESRMSKRKLLFDSFLILRSIFSFYRSSQN
jgi:glycosyltransferase involved in cell wall biosynthesis